MKQPLHLGIAQVLGLPCTCNMQHQSGSGECDSLDFCEIFDMQLLSQDVQGHTPERSMSSMRVVMAAMWRSSGCKSGLASKEAKVACLRSSKQGKMFIQKASGDAFFSPAQHAACPWRAMQCLCCNSRQSRQGCADFVWRCCAELRIQLPRWRGGAVACTAAVDQQMPRVIDYDADSPGMAA